MKNPKIILILLCLVSLLAFCACAKQDAAQEATESVAITDDIYYVHLIINPDVIFAVDADNTVISVLPQNDDAQHVLDNIELSEMDLHSVICVWVTRCNEMGFQTDSAEISVSEGREEVLASLGDVFDELGAICQVADTITASENIEWPTCPDCGTILFSQYDSCPDCGHSSEREVYYCFCGALMDPGEDICPVCHLNNPTGYYEEGWGPNGREENPEPEEETIEEILCFCGQSAINPETGICPVCHLNNTTGYYEEGYCPNCHGSNVYIDKWICGICFGAAYGQARCFQCGGAGTDYVTAADGGDGWYETCSNCGGSGTVVCDGCKGNSVADVYYCSDCGACWGLDY